MAEEDHHEGSQQDRSSHADSIRELVNADDGFVSGGSVDDWRLGNRIGESIACVLFGIWDLELGIWNLGFSPRPVWPVQFQP
jgi:hypothetical protein